MKLMLYLSTFYLIVQSVKSNEESKSKDYLFDIPDLSIFYDVVDMLVL